MANTFAPHAQGSSSRPSQTNVCSWSVGDIASTRLYAWRAADSGVIPEHWPGREPPSSDGPLEPLERLRPAVSMKTEACRGLERSLIEDDASASVCRLKRQRDQRLLVVGV